MYRKKNEKQNCKQSLFPIRFKFSSNTYNPLFQKKLLFCTGDVQALLVKKFRKWKVIIYLKNTISKELLLQYYDIFKYY